MTALKAHEVERFLVRPDLNEGVFLAYGPDAGLVRESASRLARHFAGPGGEIVTLEGAELDADPGRLAVEAKTGSLFGDKRVLRVRNAGKGLVLVLTELLDDPAGAAVILEAGNLTPKDALRALVETKKLGRALPCYPDSDETLLKLITETFNREGIRAEPDVATTLRDTLGNDREVTRRELEKIVLYSAQSKTVTRNDVLLLCADNAALALDEVLDAMGSGHAARLETALNRALAAAINPQQMLGAAQLHFSALRRWRAEVDQGRSPAEVLDAARPKPHFSRKATLLQQLRLWTDEAIAAAAERLQLAALESRQRYDLQDVLVRRALLAICLMASER